MTFNPKRLPLNPDTYYRGKGWLGWGDFDFMSMKRGDQFYSFNEFQKIVQEHRNDILKFEGRDSNAKYLKWLRSLKRIKAV